MGRGQKQQRFRSASERKRTPARTLQLDGRLKRARTEGEVSSRFAAGQEASRGSDLGRAPNSEPPPEFQWIGERPGRSSSARARQVLFRRRRKVVHPRGNLRDLPAERGR